MNDEQIEYAKQLASLGVAQFTLDHPTLPTCIGRHRPDEPCDGKRGKHPVPVSWPKASSVDAAGVIAELRRGPRNTAADCGKSGLVVLDEDREGDLDRAAEAFGAPMPDTFTVLTGKGRHLWFRQPPGLPFTNRVGRFRDYSIDVRGRGGYVVCPGSQHETGRRYTALDWSAGILPVPDWVAAALRWTPPAPPLPATSRPSTEGASGRAVAGVLRFVLDATPGCRNGALYWGALRLWEQVRDGRIAALAAESMLLDAATTIGLPDSESRATVTSARKAVLGG